jgi:RNA polymerase sigma-70 factor (ECF subfamily)
MPNDERRKNDECRMPNGPVVWNGSKPAVAKSFVIHHSSFFRHSSLGIRHSLGVRHSRHSVCARYTPRVTNVTRQAVERIYREESGRILATLIRVARDFDLADDAMQDAFAKALKHWPLDGLPDNPAAWITRAARNCLIDLLRRERTRRVVSLSQGWSGNEKDHADPATLEDGSATLDMLDKRLDSSIEDDRLRLIFTCCHPALNSEAQVALTLRTLGGLTTPEIARAFLIPVAAVAQRIVRAKRKIKHANIPYSIPTDELLPKRLTAVLAVVYLIFNEGYSATSDRDLIRNDLCAEAIRLTRLLAVLMPDEAEVLGLLALLLFHDSRRHARTSSNGDLVLLEDQDRSQWDANLIREGQQLLERALRLRRPGNYQLQAAIAAVHAEAARPEETDWPQIVALYQGLAEFNASPVIALNRAVAVAFAEGYDRGLALLDELKETGSLTQYQYFHAARADLLRRIGRHQEARTAYESALQLATNAVERRFLEQRLKECCD